MNEPLAALERETPEWKTLDPIERMSETYRAVRSYEATVRSSNAADSHIIRYGYHKPGFVRIDFIDPHHDVVIIYDPHSRTVRLWPAGIAGQAMLTLDPDDPLIHGPGGQRVDRSDIGALLENVRALQHDGMLQIVDDQPSFGNQTLHAVIRGAPCEAPGYISRYDLWIDTVIGLPAKIESRDARGGLIETVVMDDLRINVDFPERFFSP